MQNSTIPRWINEEAVTAFVKKELEEADIEDGRQFAQLPWDRHPDIPLSEFLSDLESDAVQSAKRGEVVKLAGLLRPEHPANRSSIGPPIWSQLAPATRTLVADFLTGKRNPRNGKPKGERGRATMSEEERRQKNPVHDADDMVRTVEALLQRFYPNQSRSDISDRATLIAATLKGVKSKTLENHRNRSKDDRRRIRREHR